MSESMDYIPRELEQNGHYKVGDLLPNVELVVVGRIWRRVTTLKDYGYGKDKTNVLVEWLQGGEPGRCTGLVWDGVLWVL
jgi:hypothetical protein